MLIAYTVHLVIPMIEEKAHKHVFYQQQAVDIFQIQNTL